MASSNARAPKQPRTEVSAKQELDMTMVGKLLMLLLSLRHSLEIRELQSAVFKTVVIAKDSSFVSEAQEATRSCTGKAKVARDSRNSNALEELGEPPYHSWAAMIKVAITNDQTPSADLSVLEEHFKGVRSVGDLVDKVFIAKVKRCFDKRMSKILKRNPLCRHYKHDRRPRRIARSNGWGPRLWERKGVAGASGSAFQDPARSAAHRQCARAAYGSVIPWIFGWLYAACTEKPGGWV